MNYFLPQFFSSDFLKAEFDGSDEVFDFDLLQEDDYCQIPGSQNCSFSIGNLVNRSLANSTPSSVVKDDNYAWVSQALGGQEANSFVKTNRFYGSENYVPEGQSLWYQTFNADGRGVGFLCN